MNFQIRHIIFFILCFVLRQQHVASQIDTIPNLIVWVNASNIESEDLNVSKIINIVDLDNGFTKVTTSSVLIDSISLRGSVPGLYFTNNSYRSQEIIGTTIADYTVFCVYYPLINVGYVTDSEVSRFIAPGFLASNGITFFRGNNYISSNSYLNVPTYYVSNLSNPVEIILNGDTLVLGSNNYNQNTINSKLVFGSHNNGTSTFFNGYLYEYILFNRKLETNETTLINNYIKNKYTAIINLQSDTLVSDFCPITISIDNPEDFTSILWSNGSDSSQTIINRAGEYYVSAKGQFGFTDVDTIQVHYPGNYLKSFSLCNGLDSVWNTQLNKQDYTFLWQDGSTDSLMIMDQPGDYYCSITSIGGCTYDTDTVTFTWDTYSTSTHLPQNPTICSNGILSLESGADESVSYQWFSDASPSVSISTEASIVPDQSQNYWVIAQNDIGCEAIDTTFVTLLEGVPSPIPGFSTALLCSGQSIQFNDTSIQEESTIQQWEWSTSDQQSSSLQDPSFSFSDYGQVVVSLKVTNTQGCSSFIQKNLFINPTPIVDLSIQDNLCTNTLIQFQDESSIPLGSLNEWNWFVDDQLILNQSPPNQLTTPFQTVGMHQLTQVVTSDSGCVSSLDTLLQFRGTPVSLFISDTVCVGTPVSLIALSDTSNAGPVFYEWYTPNGYIGGAEEIDIATGAGTNYLFGGQYSITLVTHTTDNYCTDTLPSFFRLEALPDIQIFRDQACIGEITTLSADVDGGIQYITSWQWELEDNTQGSDPEFSFIPSTSGYVSYSFLSSTQLLGCETLIQDSVEIFNFPSAFFNGPNEACINEEINFQVQILPEDSSTGLEFDWKLNSNYYSSDTMITLFSQLPGNNLLSLQVTNAGNCESDYSNALAIFGATVNIDFIQACEGVATQLFAIPDTLFSGPTSSEWEIENEFYSGHYLAIDLGLAGDYWVSNTITDTEHNCIDRDSILVKVSDWPIAFFNVPTLCEDELFTLFSNSEEGNDPIDETIWLLNDETEVSGISFSHSFSDAGMYDLKLIVITEEAHCTDTLFETLNVEMAPLADFTFQPETGQVPLEVGFVNLSDSAISYTWTFANNVVSFDPDPLYLFVDSGWVSINLMATSNAGCNDEKSDSIYILPPRIDIEVIEVIPEWDGNFVTIKARVQNNGYYTVTEFESLTSLGLNSPLKEIEQLEIPGADHRVTDPSSSWYIDPKGQAFACVEVSLVDGTKDEVPENDKLCVALSSDRFVIYDPYPNPGTDQLNIRMILHEEGDITVLLYTSEGQMLLNITYNGIEGFNQLELNTSSYSAGNYQIMVQFDGKDATFSWVKN